MKNACYAALLGILMFACRKENTTSPGTPAGYLQTVQTALHDSLTMNDYASLDFSRAVTSGIDSLNIHLLRCKSRQS